MQVHKDVPPHFYDYIFDWEHETYIVGGGYGSGKSYATALKLILKLFQERRIALVVREVFETLHDSCFSLIYEILDELNLLEHNKRFGYGKSDKVVVYKSPLSFRFPNGSKIIFKGLDNPEKIKSINGVSIVWIEEATEVKATAYNELLGRIRVPKLSMHFILTFNPVDKNNWVFRNFFENTNENGKIVVIQNEDEFYKQRIVDKGKFYYHHSIPEDNPYLPQSYLDRLDDIKLYDPDLWRVAKLGVFGAIGNRVLPQFCISETNKEVYNAVRNLGKENLYCGMDFGFEESYNAVVNVGVDLKNKILYIYREYYKNKMTDLETVNDDEFQKYKKYFIIADCAEPKAIKFYKDMGFRMRGCKKFGGSRLENTRKVKRFKKIICAPCCINTIKELKDLTYKKDRQGNIVYDEFNIDPHTFNKIA